MTEQQFLSVKSLLAILAQMDYEAPDSEWDQGFQAGLNAVRSVVAEMTREPAGV